VIQICERLSIFNRHHRQVRIFNEHFFHDRTWKNQIRSPDNHSVPRFTSHDASAQWNNITWIWRSFGPSAFDLDSMTSAVRYDSIHALQLNSDFCPRIPIIATSCPDHRDVSDHACFGARQTQSCNIGFY
jgi:hypothetical protein